MRSTATVGPGLLITLLSACGGGGDVIPPAKEDPHAPRIVALTDMPNLSRCLGQLDTALQKNPGQREVGLDCAAGIYRGLTTDGRDCALKVDGETGEFQFQFEREVVTIQWDNVARAADGSPIHNLEDASAPGQPGVQLTRFTGSLVPITEALILSVGTGVPMLAKMIYQLTTGGATSSVLCNFGK
jgi:hypothetical protein